MTTAEIVAGISRNVSNLVNRRKDPATLDFEDLRDSLSYHHSMVQKALHHTHRHAKRLFRKHRLTFKNLRHAGTKATAGAALAGSLFISPVHSQDLKMQSAAENAKAQIPSPSTSQALTGPINPSPNKMTQSEFGSKIQEIMKNTSRDGKLSDAQFAQIQQLVHDQLGVDTSTKTDTGFGLNKDYGYMGAEQHIPTHPGDTASSHVNKFDPTAIASGLTRGRGAWGYAPASEEKWYVVAQTFLSDQFGTSSTKDLGGQRYIVIEVPENLNGNYTTVIRGALWDAGPGVRTGKVFGGSPEFFHQLGPAAGSSRKTKVIMLPETGARKPADQLGPLNAQFKQ